MKKIEKAIIYGSLLGCGGYSLYAMTTYNDKYLKRIGKIFAQKIEHSLTFRQL